MVASAFDTLNIPVILGTIIFGAGVIVAYIYFSLRKNQTTHETKRKVISLIFMYALHITVCFRRQIQPIVVRLRHMCL